MHPKHKTDFLTKIRQSKIKQCFWLNLKCKHIQSFKEASDHLVINLPEEANTFLLSEENVDAAILPLIFMLLINSLV